MKEIIRVGRTLIAYLKRPDLYPELGRKIQKNVFQRGMATKGQAASVEWAQAQAMSTQDFLQNVLGLKDPKSFKDLFPEDFQYATEKEKACSTNMGGAGNLELIYYLCEYTEAQNAVETGVAYGWSSLASLESLSKRNGTLYSSDMPYLAQNGDSNVGTVVPERLRKYWKLFRFADRESLPKIFEECEAFDFVHYDSDKSYNGMKWAYSQLFSRLNSKGFFVSDDINDNSAFMDFCQENALQPSIIEFENKYIGVIQKS